MHRVHVYSRPDVFAGWPANHGHWQWGNELLVGFMVGQYDAVGNGMHSILRPYTKTLARSLDGGVSWDLETPNVDFNCVEGPTPAPPFSLFNPDTIIRVCGVYDTGGEDCHPNGGFYLSRDRGHNWEGPFAFTPYESDADEHFTGRTCVLENRVYVSTAKRMQWGTDFVVEMTHDGKEFTLTGVVWKDHNRTVMPAIAYLPHTDRYVIVARRKGREGNWIDAFGRDGINGSWQLLNAIDPVAYTGSHNGNPPALVARGTMLYCAYGDRSRKTIDVAVSADGGVTWKPLVTLATSPERDLGYPRLFTRIDGQLVCVYYVADHGAPARIEACVFDPDAIEDLRKRAGN